MEVEVGATVFHVDTAPCMMSLREFISRKTTSLEGNEDPFYVVDLGRLVELYRDWACALPTVAPFYAVKCNEDPALLKTLAALGTGFDCASKNEIKTVLDLGVSPDRIIYANPCKQTSHLKYAARKEVSLVTFDNEPELHKIKKHFPTARLVLRIRADDPKAICQLGVKFGCSVLVGKELLKTAIMLGLNVVGVSFHVGSGCQSPSAYKVALEMVAELFRYGASMGCRFSVLDIGGGFPGSKGTSEQFLVISDTINKSLELHFSSDLYPNLNTIAEPGRYFACSTHAIAVNVISKRICRNRLGGGTSSFMYYVNDGVYGSFNCILFDHVTPIPKTLKEPPSGSAVFPSSLWGPTCDSMDRIGATLMAEVQVGDWIYFDDMGAYTRAAASCFNGFLKPIAYYYVTDNNLERLYDLLCPSDYNSCALSCPSPTLSLGSVSGGSVDEDSATDNMYPQEQIEVY